MSERERGIMVYPMPEEVCGLADRYALLIAGDQARMVHRQGVAYLVTDDRPWRWSDYDTKCPIYTARDCKGSGVG